MADWRFARQRTSGGIGVAPRPLKQAKIPRVAANEMLYHLVWGLSSYQIAGKQGRNQPITMLRHPAERVVAYAEERRLKQVT